MMNSLLFILLLSATHSFTGYSVVASLECTPQQTCVCAGAEVNLSCTAACNEIILWSGSTTPSFNNLTQACNSPNNTESHLPVKVINFPSCSDTFTSRLSYNASLGMGDSTTIVQINCSIIPESTPSPSCSPMTVPSQMEQNSSFTLCVTNCTGMNSPVLNPCLLYTSDAADE